MGGDAASGDGPPSLGAEHPAESATVVCGSCSCGGFNQHLIAERTCLMSIGTILLVLLVLILVGALPSWPHSKNWGYYPSGGLGLVLVILLILLLLGRI